MIPPEAPSVQALDCFLEYEWVYYVISRDARNSLNLGKLAATRELERAPVTFGANIHSAKGQRGRPARRFRRPGLQLDPWTWKP